MVEVSLSAAVICFLGVCHPVLIGDATPEGTFTMIERVTSDSGYGGNVIQFYETETSVYAIHRVWTLIPSEQRKQRLQSNDPKQRNITAGCINVQPAVFEKILDCCINMELKINP